jgi:hypothetical protein
MLAEDEFNFWLGASQPALAEIWDNPQDDVYHELLKTNGGDNNGPGDLRPRNGD